MHGDAKASVVERFNRTLKQRMYRYFTAANTLRYEDVLQSLVRGYNVSVVIEVLEWLPKKSIKKMSGLFGNDCTDPRKKRNHSNSRWKIEFDSTRNIALSKKVVFQAGRRKSSLFEVLDEETCPPIKSRSGMTHSWKEPFTNRIFKK